MNRLGRRYGYAGITTLTALLLVGCGSTKAAAPKELVDARAAYNAAANGPAAQYNPSDLHVAKTSLDRAEQWYAQDPGAPETRTQAYLALRRSQIAAAQGQAGLAIAQRDQAERALVQAQAQALAQTRADLDQARAQLAESQRNGSAADERAMAVLERQAGAHREARGEVITLPGTLLFQTGKSELSPSARAKLDTVANALKQAPDRHIVIEGYTDSTGHRRGELAALGGPRFRGPFVPRLARRSRSEHRGQGLRPRAAPSRATRPQRDAPRTGASRSSSRPARPSRCPKTRT